MGQFVMAVPQCSSSYAKISRARSAKFPGNIEIAEMDAGKRQMPFKFAERYLKVVKERPMKASGGRLGFYYERSKSTLGW